jgi:hypothetical protein
LKIFAWVYLKICACCSQRVSNREYIEYNENENLWNNNSHFSTMKELEIGKNNRYKI